MSTAKRDYYEILGVPKDVSPEQLKKAYRRAAHKHHPDRNANNSQSETLFKEAAEAYEVLADPSKRQRYDQFGHAGLSGAGVHDFSHMGVEDIFSMFGDIFGFGGGGGRRRSRRVNLRAEVAITLAEVATGTERPLEFARNDFCERCGGNGAAPGSKRQACNTCGGYGQVEQTGGFAGLLGRVLTTCPACRGRRTTITTPCPKCRGTGRTLKERIVNIKIPAGVHEGECFGIVRGEGELGEDGADRGDLHCYVRVEQHPFFERHDNDLVCRMPISFTQASLGATVEVPTLTGKADLSIPRGTQHGQMFRLTGQGLPDLRRGRRGDELVQVLIEIPKKLNKEQEALLRDFAKTEDKSVLPESRGFFDKLMDYISRDEGASS